MYPKVFLTVVLLVTSAITSAVLAQQRVPDMAMINPDGDGTVDLAEAQAAAEALWAKINNDGDDTLELDELTGRVTEDEFNAANPDGDDTLEMDEWQALVEARFNEANPDGDDTIEPDEFETEAGQKLLALLQE